MERGEFERIYLRSDSAKFHFQRMCLELSRVVREQCATTVEKHAVDSDFDEAYEICRGVAMKIRALQPKAVSPDHRHIPFEDEENFAKIVEAYKHIGYGWMMQKISEIWQQEVGDGAFCITETYNGLAAKKKRCASEGHDWRAGGSYKWCDRCNERGEKDAEKCNEEGPAKLRCSREAGHDGTHSGGVSIYQAVTGYQTAQQEAPMSPGVAAARAAGRETEARQEGRRKALGEVHDYLKMFACNCDAAGNKGGHLLTCPKALAGWVETRLDE